MRTLIRNSINKLFKNDIVNKFLLLLSSVFLPVCFLTAQVDETDNSKYEKVGELIDLIYSVEDFQLRFGSLLENNPTFKLYETDVDFIKDLTAIVQESALNSYATSIREAFTAEMTELQIDSLIDAYRSPYGEILRKANQIDNRLIENKIRNYVNRIVELGVQKIYFRDSLLYEQELSSEIEPIMDGTYIDSLDQNNIVKIIRKGTLQTESINGFDLKYEVNWLTNSKYSLTDHSSNLYDTGPNTIFVNIYEIEGDKFKFIFRLPDGTYAKSEMTKDSYVSYEQEIETFQIGLREQYSNAHSSPLTDDEVMLYNKLGGHQFFELNKQFKVTADFEVYKNPSIVNMATSSSSEVAYYLYGKATFKLAGTTHNLNVYQRKSTDGTNSGDLFLPFNDLTNGSLTYGGGRYIELKNPGKGSTIEIDFNQAYQPYCAYTTGYACPIPPPENSLKLKVTAGIKHLKLSID